MHDALMLLLDERSILQEIDLETQRSVMSVHHSLEEHELVCIAPAHGADMGNALYAGAVCGIELRAAHLYKYDCLCNNMLHCQKAIAMQAAARIV